MGKRYLTVSEAAAVLGISKQAVYRKLNNQFKPFSTTVNGHKVLKIEALTDEQRKMVDNQVDNSFNQVDQPDSTNTDPLIDVLRQELEAKDRQIEAQAAQIDKLMSLLWASQQHAAALEAHRDEPRPRHGWIARLFHRK